MATRSSTYPTMRCISLPVDEMVSQPSRANLSCCPSSEGDAPIDEVIRDGLEIEVMGEHHASSCLCTSQSFFHSSGAPALPTLLQYYCTVIGQHTTSLSTSLWYATHHTILAITILCKGQCQMNRP